MIVRRKIDTTFYNQRNEKITEKDMSAKVKVVKNAAPTKIKSSKKTDDNDSKDDASHF